MMDLPAYTPERWHWLVAETGRYWSSADRAYRPEGELPVWFTPIGTGAELREVLERAGFADRAPGYVPPFITMAQARVVLHRAGLLSAVEAAVAAAGGEVQIAWEYSQTVSRQSALIAALAPALGLSDATLDQLFRDAAVITF